MRNAGRAAPETGRSLVQCRLTQGKCRKSSVIKRLLKCSHLDNWVENHRERLGPNESGIVHYSTGVAPKNCVNVAPLFDKAAQQGVLSIGIGDNGNEIGFGRIHSFMQDFHPYGRETQTSKPGGAITVTATDIFLPASISNWGAYGIAAMLGFLLKDKELVQDSELEKRIIRACLDAGGWEMRYCTSRFIVDGAEGESSMAIVQLLRDMVRLNIAAPDRGLSHGKMKEVQR
ncbi:glutamate cyclase domain-containing protein [Halomonas sp. JB37]|uniref:glutamate cyclase domain-containing protein n=2 Tax=Halomonadaceae TaxID=28256 RepID=UPI0020D0A7D9|nr:glutamate cyclase domain-containing protein [Halomonas sp. JB37]